MEEEINVVIWTDPDWTPALEAFRLRGEVAPLAALLRSGMEVPAEVAAEIGILLDPPKGYRGPKLRLEFPKRARARFLETIAEKRKLRQRIIDAKGAGKLEAALSQLQSETGLARSTLLEAKKMDDRHAVFQSLILLRQIKSKN